MESLLSFDVLKFLIPFGFGVFAWLGNEQWKRAWEEYQRKEQHYTELLRALKGFYVESNDTSLRQEFVTQLNLCWLYCPDDVIRSGYRFLDSVHTGRVSTPEEKEKALGDFIFTIRRDLLSRKITRRTTLRGRDFRHLRAT